MGLERCHSERGGLVIASLGLNSSSSTSSTVKHKDVMGLGNLGLKGASEKNRDRMREGGIHSETFREGSRCRWKTGKARH